MKEAEEADHLEFEAARAELSFGSKDGKYTLEPMTDEAIAAFKRATAESED